MKNTIFFIPSSISKLIFIAPEHDNLTLLSFNSIFSIPQAEK